MACHWSFTLSYSFCTFTKYFIPIQNEPLWVHSVYEGISKVLTELLSTVYKVFSCMYYDTHTLPSILPFLCEKCYMWCNSTCNYLLPAVLSSLSHLITPCPQYSVLQTPTALIIKYQQLIALIIFLSGIRDLKTVSVNSTLAELGMDSMITVEIKETLEREFEVYLTPQEIRNLTIVSLDKLSAANQCTEVDKQQLEGTHTILF